MIKIPQLKSRRRGFWKMGAPLWAACLGSLFAAQLVLAAGSAGYKKPKVAPPLGEILARMNDSAKRLKTVSANIESTKVTVVVDDKSTEFGELFFQKGKSTEILLNFTKPDPKVILFKKNKAEIYFPKSNQIQEYNLEKRGGMVEQFMLLSFGTETGELQKAYMIKLNGEEVLDGDTTAILELAPRSESISSQFPKVQLWISEESWIPVQQKLFQAGGDYLITRYTAVKVNRRLPPSTFELPAPSDAKRMKME
jgi:outer membrane lipoprotein-sorting protein